MVTQAQIAKLDSRIDQLADKLACAGVGRIEFEVEFVWIETDGRLTDEAGNTVPPHVPGVITLAFE